MSISAIILMIVILGLVWGGFVMTLRLAIKKDSDEAP